MSDAVGDWTLDAFAGLFGARRGQPADQRESSAELTARLLARRDEAVRELEDALRGAKAADCSVSADELTDRAAFHRGSAERAAALAAIAEEKNSLQACRRPVRAGALANAAIAAIYESHERSATATRR